MKRFVVKGVINMCVKSILLTTIVGVVIGTLGYLKQWNSSITYSNAFFLAGCLLIIAGGSSRLGAGQEWNNFQMLYAESFRDMSVSERANFILDASSPVNTVILGLLSGMLLLIVSVFVAKLF